MEWTKTSKRILRNDIFEKYYQLMKSSSQRAKIIALQKLNELLRDGYVLLPTDGDKLDKCLLELLCKTDIEIGQNDAIRRCAYRICARRFNPEIRNICFQLLGKEVCLDNKMSIIPVLLQNDSFEHFNRKMSIVESTSELSYQQIQLAQFACPNFNESRLDKALIENFLTTNDITALRFLSIIYDERPQDPFRGSEFLNCDLFGELANHPDPWVQKYALGTFPKRKKFRIQDLKISPSSFLSLDAQPQKWVMTDLFLDRSFVKQNQDLIRFILSEHYLFEECDIRVKEGIAQGLLYFGYNVELANFVIPWYSQEKESAVKVLLRSYMMTYRGKNQEFNYILTEELSHHIEYNDASLYFPENTQGEKPTFLPNLKTRVPNILSRQRKENPRTDKPEKIDLYDSFSGKTEELLWKITNSVINRRTEQHTTDSYSGAKDILEIFKQWVEYNKGWKIIQEMDSKNREKDIQQMIYLAGLYYIKANDLDMSREPDEGRGPVDFKISKGQDTTIIEVKLTSNCQSLRGYDVQIEEYGRAEQTNNMIYALINLGDADVVNKVQKLHDKKSAEGANPPDLIVINATKKESASKTRLS